MKNKKRYILPIIIIIVLIIRGFSIVNLNKNNEDTSKISSSEDEELKLLDKQVEFIKSLVGLESKEMQILDNPLRLEGTFIIPEKTLLKGIQYYLETFKNTDIKDVKVSINNDGIRISGRYNLFLKFMTPVELTVVPSLTKDGDLKLDLNDIKVLKLKINDKIIDSIVESWFSNLKGISTDNGGVVIDKSDFKGVSLKSLSVESSNLIISISVKFS